MSGTRGSGKLLLPCSGRAHVGSMLRIRPRHRPSPAALPATRGEDQRKRMEISYFRNWPNGKTFGFDQFFDQAWKEKKNPEKRQERGRVKGGREGGERERGQRVRRGWIRFQLRDRGTSDRRSFYRVKASLGNFRAGSQSSLLTHRETPSQRVSSGNLVGY